MDVEVGVLHRWLEEPVTLACSTDDWFEDGLAWVAWASQRPPLRLGLAPDAHATPTAMNGFLVQVTALTDARIFSPIELPEPVAIDDTVVVRVRTVALCGTDLKVYLGQHPRFRPPSVLGHEFAGTVEAVGDLVADLVPGTRVCVDPTVGCGTCRMCAAGRKNICHDYRLLGEDMSMPGGLAGLVAVPRANVHPIPDMVSFEAAAIVQPMSVSYRAAIEQGRIAAGDTVVVLGAGAIGDGILLAARSVGARVLVADTLPYRLDVATELGADRVVDVRNEDLKAVVLEETDGYGADVTLEAVAGSGDEILPQAIDVTARGGRIVVVGLKSEEVRIPIGRIKWEEKVIIGSQAYLDRTMPEVVERIADGSLPVDRLITHRLPFSEIEQAFALLESRAQDVLKVVMHDPNTPGT